MGNTAQRCIGSRWSRWLSCPTGRVCLCLGSRCRSEPPCVAPGSGCPTRGEYDGIEQLVERLPPVRVSPCIPGGPRGREVSYQEDAPEERRRELEVEATGCAVSRLDYSQVFGLRVDGTISSARSKALGIERKIPPGKFAQLYRQTTKVKRIATLWRGDALVGTATLIDWKFSRRIEIGPRCPVSSAQPFGKSAPTECRTWRDRCPTCRDP